MKSWRTDTPGNRTQPHYATTTAKRQAPHKSPHAPAHRQQIGAPRALRLSATACEKHRPHFSGRNETPGEHRVSSKLLLEFFQPQPNFVLVFAGQIRADELAMDFRCTMLMQVGGFSRVEPLRRVWRNQPPH